MYLLRCDQRYINPDKVEIGLPISNSRPFFPILAIGDHFIEMRHFIKRYWKMLQL